MHFCAWAPQHGDGFHARFEATEHLRFQRGGSAHVSVTAIKIGKG
jgi:hypothetical protein